MSAFWMIGIGINVVTLAGLVYWAVKNWTPRDPPRPTPPGQPSGGAPTRR